MNDTPRHWQPLRKMSTDEFHPTRPEVIATVMRMYDCDEAAAHAMMEKLKETCIYYTNNLYQVQVAKCGPEGDMLHICIRRNDGAHDIRDWRHFQQIKNEVAGAEREAFELYPRESRKVDASNKYHLWVLPEGVSMDAVGWTTRDVQYVENKDVPGLRQRSL